MTQRSTKHLVSTNTWHSLATEYLSMPDAPRTGWDDLLAHCDNCVVTIADDLLAYKGRIWQTRSDAGEIIATCGDLRQAEKDHCSGGDAIPVQDVYGPHPFWTNEQTAMYRVWHDTGHLESNKGFDAVAEMQLFALDALQLESEHAVDALFNQIISQLAVAVVEGQYREIQYARVLGPAGRALRDALLLSARLEQEVS